jgi:hypothetical protein
MRKVHYVIYRLRLANAQTPSEQTFLPMPEIVSGAGRAQTHREKEKSLFSNNYPAGPMNKILFSSGKEE